MPIAQLIVMSFKHLDIIRSVYSNMYTFIYLNIDFISISLFILHFYLTAIAAIPLSHLLTFVFVAQHGEIIFIIIVAQNGEIIFL